MLVVIILAAFMPGLAGAAYVGDKEITSKGACVLDFETGIQLFGFEEEKHRVPASMTKMLAVYVIYDAIKAGEISLETTAKISSGVSSFSYNREYSNVPLPKDALVKIDNLLDVVIVVSACAATDALGEALCGDKAAFVKRMNEKVAQLGIDAVFYDSYGGSANNSITPRGMAELSRSLIMDHPEVLKKSQQKTITFRDLKYNNTNPLLGQYSGLDGLKTGSTNAAGNCFVGTAEKDGRRIISVTMGSVSSQARSSDSRILLDYGFTVADSVIAEALNENEQDPGPGEASGSEPENNTVYSVHYIDGYRFLMLRFIEYTQGGADRQSEVVMFSAYLLSTIMQFAAAGAETDAGLSGNEEA